MAYQKRNFQKEQLLKADDLNAMDEQIAKNEKSAGEAKSVADKAKDAADKAKDAADKAKDAAENALSVMKFAFVDHGELTSENNIDDITEPGMYRWFDDAPVGNPVSDAAMMVVFRSGSQNIITQTVTSIYPREKTVKRTMYPGGWSKWAELLEDDSEVMIFRRTLTASDDFNAVTQIGVYNYSEGNVPANAPFTTGDVTVMAYGDGTQIATGRFQEKLHLKVRCGIPNTESWSTWHDLINNGLVYRGALFDVDYLNDVVEDGIYNITNNKNGDLPSNMPDGIEGYGGTMMVYGYTGDLSNCTVQTMLVTDVIGHGVIPKFKMRIGTRDGIWTSWTSLVDVGQLEIIEEQIDDLENQINNMTSSSGGAEEQLRMLGNATYTTGIMEFDEETKSAVPIHSHYLECTKGAEGFTVVLSPGNACIAGMFFGLNEEKTFTFDPSITKENSYQTYIGIKAYPETGIITLDVKEDLGARYWPSEERYELGLAWIYAPAGSTEPSEMTIIDIRYGYKDPVNGVSFEQKAAKYLGFPGEKRYQHEQELALTGLYTNGILDNRIPKELAENDHPYVYNMAISRHEPFAVTASKSNGILSVNFGKGSIMVDGRIYNFWSAGASFADANLTGAAKNTVIGVGFNPKTGERYWINEDVDRVIGNIFALKTDPETGEERYYPYQGRDLYEAILAVVKVTEGATEYTSDMVMDVRNSPMCGYAFNIIQNMYGTQGHPTYNGKKIALLEDVPNETETLTITYEDGTTGTLEVYKK